MAWSLVRVEPTSTTGLIMANWFQLQSDTVYILANMHFKIKCFNIPYISLYIYFIFYDLFICIHVYLSDLKYFLLIKMTL